MDIATVLDPPLQMKPVSLEGESPTLNYENMSKIFQVAAIPITKQKGQGFVSPGIISCSCFQEVTYLIASIQ